MAKNNDPQPEPETSSEYEESGTESESEEELRHQQTPARTPPPPPPRANPAVSESDSDSDESSEDEAPPKTEPVAVVQNPGSIKKSKSAQASSVSSKLTGTKRGADVNAPSDRVTKKGKKEDSLVQKDNVNDAKKTPFQRIWSDDDEILLLRGILDFVEETGTDPYVEINSFLEFIRKKIHVNVNKEQLRSKIRSLNKKFTNRQTKEVDGKDPTFSKPHEHQAYQLYKQIWGKGNKEIVVGSITPKVPPKPKMKKENNVSEHSNGVEPAEVSNVVKTDVDCETVQKLPNFEAPQWLREALKVGSEMFEGGKVSEGSKAWKTMKHREMDLYLELLQLNVNKTKLVFDAIKSRDL